MIKDHTSAPDSVDTSTHDSSTPRTTDSQETLKQLHADQAPALIRFVDDAGRCIGTNLRWQQFTGRSAQDDCGHDWLYALHPEDRAQAAEQSAAALQSRSHHNMSYRVRSHDGSYHRVIDASMPRYAEDGSYAGYVAYGRELGEAARAEERLRVMESQNRFLLEFARALQPVTSYDELLKLADHMIRHRFGFTSTSFFVLPEQDAEELMMVSISGKIAEGIRAHYSRLPRKGDAMIEEILEGNGPVVVEDARIDPRTNKEIVEHMRLVSIVNVPILLMGSQIGALGMTTTIDEGIRVPGESEIELFEKMASLVGTVIERIRHIEEQKEAEAKLIVAKEQAEKASRAKSDFLSRMSHELRTPLNAILGFSQLLELDESLKHSQRESIGEVLMAGRHLLELVNDVLELSRIETGELEFRYQLSALGRIVDEAARLVAPLAGNMGVSILNETMDNPLELLIDPVRLKQALVNVLTNAIKYNVDDGEVRITIEQPVSGRLRLCVRDTGIGISSKRIDKLFEPFERGMPDQANIDGTGIGLSIARYLIENMGGVIGVESSPGHGSLFWFDLPLADSTHHGDLSAGTRSIA